MIFFADFLNSGIRLTTPILFAAIASMLSARAGVLNLAIESKVLMGAFVGILVAATTGNTFVGVLAAAAAGAVIGAIMAMAHLFGVDLVVLAIGLNILVLQSTVFFMRSFLGGVGTYKPDVDTVPAIVIPLLSDLPFVGNLLSARPAPARRRRGTRRRRERGTQGRTHTGAHAHRCRRGRRARWRLPVDR